MITLEKKSLITPKIQTESEKIFNEFKSELSALNERVQILEKEREQHQETNLQLFFQQELMNESIQQFQEEKFTSQENFDVLANVIHHLKTPVNDVMENLNQIMEDIEDQEIQDSLRECIQTTDNVLQSFNDIEEYCTISSQHEHQFKSELINTYNFFRQIITQFNENNFTKKHHILLKIDQEVPKQLMIKSDLLQKTLLELLKILDKQSMPGQISIHIFQNTEKELYGYALQELKIICSTNKNTDLKQMPSLPQTLKNNQSIEMQGLVIKKMLQKANGTFEFIGDDFITGFEIKLPLPNLV